MTPDGSSLKGKVLLFISLFILCTCNLQRLDKVMLRIRRMFKFPFDNNSNYDCEEIDLLKSYIVTVTIKSMVINGQSVK